MKLKVNGGWWQFTRPLRNLERFDTHGALCGRSGEFSYGGSLGELDSVYHESVKKADYVVYSYITPIAWHISGEGWVTPDEKYSMTTSKHQGRIFTAISQLKAGS